MRRAVTGLICLLLAACAGIGPGGAPERLALRNGAVTAAGPAGYCADASSSRPARGFAVFAACASLGVEDAALPGIVAVATVQVGEAGSAFVTGDEVALAAVLEAEMGRAMLSRRQQMNDITIRRTETGPGLVLVSFTDTHPAEIAGVEAGEFRAFFDIGDRLVTVSLRGLADRPLSASAGENLVSRFVTAMQQANAPVTASGS